MVRFGMFLVMLINVGFWFMREDFFGLIFILGLWMFMFIWLLDSELRYVWDVEGCLLLYGLYVFLLINVGFFIR